jgi:hypothetical protein
LAFLSTARTGDGHAEETAASSSASGLAPENLLWESPDVPWSAAGRQLKLQWSTRLEVVGSEGKDDVDGYGVCVEVARDGGGGRLVWIVEARHDLAVVTAIPPRVAPSLLNCEGRTGPLTALTCV